MKIIKDLEQGSPEWHKERRCMITGSKMDNVMGSNLDQLMLICELIAEEMTEQSKAFKETAEMQRGTEEEVFARKHFEKKTKKTVKEIGFCKSDEYSYLGISGDGWIENNGILDEAIEIKCPDSKQSVFYKLADTLSATELGLGSWSAITKANPEPVFKESAKAPFLGIPAQYVWQVITYFMVNEKLQTLNFTVYDARFIDEESKMHIVVLDRKNELVQNKITEAFAGLVEFRTLWLKCREAVIINKS